MNAIAPASSFKPQVIAQDELLSALRNIVGRKHVLTGPRAGSSSCRRRTPG
jgi:hypothetical protein